MTERPNKFNQVKKKIKNGFERKFDYKRLIEGNMFIEEMFLVFC